MRMSNEFYLLAEKVVVNDNVAPIDKHNFLEQQFLGVLHESHFYRLHLP
jgi:hypothetical protein